MESRPKQQDIRLKEMEYRMTALDINNISRVCTTNCSKCRFISGCINNYRCNDQFDGAAQSVAAVLHIRQRLWLSSNGTKARQALLGELLLENLIVDPVNGRRAYKFRINGVNVCLDFFQKACGCKRRMFMKQLKYVLWGGTRQKIMPGSLKSSTYFDHPHATDEMRFDYMDHGNKSMIRKNKDDKLEAFFHDHFHNGVDCEPGMMRVKYTRYTWREVYNGDYKAHCEALGDEMDSYHSFCRVRKSRCPQYKRARQSRPGGWNHLSCKTCDNLKRLIASKSIRLEDEEECKGYKASLLYHQEFQDKHRREYYRTRAKAIRNRDHDVSMVVDAAGGAGTTYQPRYHTTEKGEPARHMMCKVKHTFVKMHGIGTLIVQSLPDLEAQGANLTVECILRGVREALKYRNGRNIRNLYIQMDNVSSNKCMSVFAGVAALVLLGIVRKIKISYLIVGHTHEDVDAFIGNVVSKIRRMDIRTFNDLRDACINAVKLDGSKVLDVERAIGITDYSKLFEHVDKISGISKVRTVRISAKPDGDGINMYYKDDATKPGWYPRPTAAQSCYSWSKVFIHPTNPDVKFESLLDYGPLCENGKRQEWHYNVKFVDGSVHGFTFPCPSLPFNLTRSDVEDAIKSATHQEFRGKMTQIPARETLARNIGELLEYRGDSDAVQEWTNFISQLPTNDTPPDVHTCVLKEIIDTCKGDVQIPAKYIKMNVAADPSDASEFVDPICFPGGPVSWAERDRILRETGKLSAVNKRSRRNLKVTTKRSKKTKKIVVKKSTDSSEDDDVSLLSCSTDVSRTDSIEERDDQSIESDYDYSSEQWTYARVAEPIQGKERYWDRINQQFIDESSGGLIGKVVAVCVATNLKNSQLFFKYYNTKKYPDHPPTRPNDFDYSLCSEMELRPNGGKKPKKSWAKWIVSEEERSSNSDDNSYYDNNNTRNISTKKIITKKRKR